jgi:hypothetical protein
VDVNTWVCVRDDPERPKAVISCVHSWWGSDVFLVTRWSLDPDQRVLMARALDLEAANNLVRFEPPIQDWAPRQPPNGRIGIGGAHLR